MHATHTSHAIDPNPVPMPYKALANPGHLRRLPMRFPSLPLIAAIALTSVAVVPASAESFPYTRQKACSMEFQKQPKETRGGLAGWQSFYKECSARKKADGNEYAKRSTKSAAAQ
jgi:hypothetical protein